jgi:hypothetical protein
LSACMRGCLVGPLGWAELDWCHKPRRSNSISIVWFTSCAMCCCAAVCWAPWCAGTSPVCCRLWDVLLVGCSEALRFVVRPRLAGLVGHQLCFPGPMAHDVQVEGYKTDCSDTPCMSIMLSQYLLSLRLSASCSHKLICSCTCEGSSCTCVGWPPRCSL